MKPQQPHPLHDPLRTQESDKPFHAARMMFWIIDSKPFFAPAGTELSHTEFAVHQGWCNHDTAQQFAQEHVRGVFLSQNGLPVLHFYTGEFQFNDSVERTAKQVIPELLKYVSMPRTTQVFLGPKDSTIHGKNYAIKYIGLIADLV